MEAAGGQSSVYIKSGFVKFMRPSTPVRFSKNPMDMYPTGTKALAALMKRLSDTDDVRLLVMMWAIHTLQGKRAARACNYIRFPREAYNAQIGSPYFAPKWEMETLVTLTLNTPKNVFPAHLRDPIDTEEFSHFAHLLNLVKKVENDESRQHVNLDTIMREFHKLGHRQFPWQTGWDNIASVYRHVFIYGDGPCAKYFAETYGVAVSDFVGCAFALYIQMGLSPFNPALEGVPFEVADGAIAKTLAMLSQDLYRARVESRALYAKFRNLLGFIPVAYHPSYLRVKPIIRYTGVKNRYIAPFPELVLMRATVGLYYDLIGASTSVMNHARTRFEVYAREVIKAYCFEFDPEPAIKYKYKSSDAETPDVLLKRAGQVVAVFECKATKLSFQAQYGDDPAEVARDQYKQIANAVFQLWRFFSHVRRGIINVPFAEEVNAVVLTMEPWTQTSKELRKKMIEEANKIAAVKEPEMTECDKRTPLFVSINELEYVLGHSDGNQVLATFKAAAEDRYAGWGAREVRRDLCNMPEKVKPYPFTPGALLPWWGNAETRARERLAGVKETS